MKNITNYKPSITQQIQIDLLLSSLSKCAALGIKVWVVGGYGLDALYGKLTRDHGDFDLYLCKSSIDRFIKTIKSFGFYPTSEKVGTVQKAVYKHKSLPSNFKLEFTSIEQAQEKLKEFNIKQFTSHKPLGMFMGYPIWTATLDEFIKIIEINDKLSIEHKRKKYPHRNWQKEILTALRI